MDAALRAMDITSSAGGVRKSSSCPGPRVTGTSASTTWEPKRATPCWRIGTMKVRQPSQEWPNWCTHWLALSRITCKSSIQHWVTLPW
ncbi:hypothetical protein D3C71_1904200 [compost metagenome]